MAGVNGRIDVCQALSFGALGHMCLFSSDKFHIDNDFLNLVPEARVEKLG